MILFLAFAVFKTASCSNIKATAESEASSVSFKNSQRLPDDLLIRIILEMAPTSIPELMSASTSLRSQIIAWSLLQKYLAKIYNFSPLCGIPFNKELKCLVWRPRGHKLSPYDLFYHLKKRFLRTLAFEMLALKLCDYFQGSSIQLSICDHYLADEPDPLNALYAQFIVDVVCNHRSLDYFVKMESWLKMGKYRFDKVPNLQSLLSRWFETEYSIFKKIFFAKHASWSQDFLVAFLNGDGTFLPTDLNKDESCNVDWGLKYFLRCEELNELVPENVVIVKCRDYVELKNDSQNIIYILFNARFNKNYTYCAVPEPNFEENNYAAALGFVLSVRFRDATELLRYMKERKKRPFYFCHSLYMSNFMIYLLKEDPELCSFHFYQLPSQFYFDQEKEDLVCSFYGSIEKYLKSDRGDFGSLGIDHYKFIIRNGTLNEFKAILHRLPVYADVVFFDDFCEYRQSDTNILEYVRCWYNTIRNWSRKNPGLHEYEYATTPQGIRCTAKFLKLALGHPDIFSYLEKSAIYMRQADWAEVQGFSEYQEASEEIKDIITRIFNICRF